MEGTNRSRRYARVLRKESRQAEKDDEGLSDACRLESVCGKVCDAVLEDIWNIYERDMLEHFPYIGGNSVSGMKNLTEAYMLVAMGEYLRRYGMTMEAIGQLMTQAYERRIMRIPSLIRKMMGKMFLDPRRLNKMFLKKDAQNRINAAKNPGSFETKTQIPPETGFDFSYHNLVCPLANFAKQYGYEEYMPYLCNLDYVLFGILGVPLFREHTCMEECGYCDFKLKTAAEPLPYWPPVFSQGKGYR